MKYGGMASVRTDYLGLNFLFLTYLFVHLNVSIYILMIYK